MKGQIRELWPRAELSRFLLVQAVLPHSSSPRALRAQWPAEQGASVELQREVFRYGVRALQYWIVPLLVQSQLFPRLLRAAAD